MDRKKKINFIYGTMTGFCSVMRNLQEDYKTCSKNYSEEALALLGFSNDFINSVEAIRTLDSIRRIDDDGINELFSLSRQIAELYRLEKQANRGDAIENLGNDITRLPAAWKIYLDKDGKVKKVRYGADKSKVQVIQLDGSTDGIIEIGTEEHKRPGGFAKRLLKAAGLNATDEVGLRLQEKMLDSGLFYINKEEVWVEKKKYFERMTPKDFLSMQDYKDVTVKAVYDDDKGELTFTYTAGGKTENLFVIKASNEQKKRIFPTDRGTLTSSPIYTMPNNKSKQIVAYIPGKFPKGTWFIESFEKSFTEGYGPYKIRTNATRQVVGYKQKYDENNILIGWEEIKNENGENVPFEDGHLLIHGGTGRIIENLTDIQKLDARKGENDYKGTTHGCIRISNLDVYLIIETLEDYLKSKGNIELEVK